ncbi:MAG: hypothetical protein NZ480_02590, partial [Bdellovibrionaceae bacterium]|nr:hypothetical protein [Pseudobdellovibrionaceae bacterium]
MRHFVVFLIFFCFQAEGKENTYSRSFDLTWEAVEGARSYEIEIYQHDQSQLVFKKTVQDTRWHGVIKPGKYLYRLRAFDYRGVPGPWSELEEVIVPLSPVTIIEPTSNAIIRSDSKEQVELTIKWSRNSALSDRFHVKIFNNASQELVFETETDNDVIGVSLPVAQSYRIQVLPISSQLQIRGIEEEMVPITVTVWGGQLSAPDLKIPDSLFIREISWTPDPKSRKHHVKIVYQKGAKWVRLFDKKLDTNKVSIPLKWPGGKYRISVTSSADLFQTSTVTHQEFELLAGDRSEKAELIYQVRRSIDSFRGWYVQLSYLISELQYTLIASIPGAQVTTIFSTLTGSGRLGIGYLNDERKIGFLGSLELAGLINQKGENLLFSYFDACGVYRTRITDLDDLRIKFGIFYKEMPLGNVDLNLLKVTEYRNLNLYGPLLGFEYWLSLNTSLG